MLTCNFSNENYLFLHSCSLVTLHVAILLQMSNLVQVATTLQVVGPTLTLWIPGHTHFASTSSYSRIIHRLSE